MRLAQEAFTCYKRNNFFLQIDILVSYQSHREKTQANKIYTAVAYNYNMVLLMNRLFWLAVNSRGRVCL